MPVTRHVYIVNVIGYYVHHQGSGHLHRALAIAAHAGTAITGLSSHPRPAGWPGDWHRAGRRRRTETLSSSPRPGGGCTTCRMSTTGCGDRMATLSAWISGTRPRRDRGRRLGRGGPAGPAARRAGDHHGPARRARDPAHTLGYAISEPILGPVAGEPPRGSGRPTRRRWPARSRTSARSAGSRVARRARRDRPRAAVLVLNGTGGEQLARAADAGPGRQPGWDWTHLGGPGAPGPTTRGRCCARPRWSSAIVARTRSPISRPPAARPS